MLVAHFRGRRQAQPANQRCPQIAENIAELIFHHQHVIGLRVLHQVQTHGVHIGGLGRNVRMSRGDLLEHSPEEGKAAKYVRLIDARHQPFAIQRTSRSFSRESKGELDDPLGPGASYDQRIGRHLVADDAATPEGCKQSLQVFAQHDKVDAESRIP